MNTDILQRLQKAVNDKSFPGCVLGIVKTNGDRVIYPVGGFTYDENAPRVTENTIYDLASVTKSIPGTASLLKLIDEGKLGLEDRLIDFVPEFGDSEDKKSVTIKHVLTYTLELDIDSMSAHKDKTPDEILNIVVHAKLRSKPGSKHYYTNSTAAFVGLIVQKVTGMGLDKYAGKNFFNPLGMRRTTFHPEKFDIQEIAPTEIDDWRGGVVQGVVHDESTYMLNKKYISGIAGLFSTAPDILNFLEMLLQKGTYKGKKYFSENIVIEMHTNQLDPKAGAAGLGWAMHWPEAMGSNYSDQAFCKSGFTGTFVMIDPVKNTAFALLSNRTYPKRTRDMTAINEVRRDVADIILA